MRSYSKNLKSSPQKEEETESKTAFSLDDIDVLDFSNDNVDKVIKVIKYLCDSFVESKNTKMYFTFIEDNQKTIKMGDDSYGTK